MKKLAILFCTICVLSGAAMANEAVTEPLKKMPPKQEQIRKAHHEAFERKLGLTEVQKLKARELRKSGHEKMEPVMKQIHAKKQEAEAIRKSKISVQAQEEQLTIIDNDIKELEKQAATIRKQNMKDFESILTREQRKTLKQMKKDGRKNFNKGKRIDLPPCPMPRPVEK